jgi:hypothetical protein
MRSKTGKVLEGHEEHAFRKVSENRKNEHETHTTMYLFADQKTNETSSKGKLGVSEGHARR